MAALTSYSTGTISIGAGATSVVGVGSIWTGGNVFAGDTLVVAGHEVTVLEVVDATHLTIEAWPYSAVTAGSSYKIYKTSFLRVTNAQIATQTASIFAALASDGYFYFIDTTETAPDPSLGDDGQYALKPSTGEVWLKTGGVWVFQGIYKAFSIKGVWSGATAYVCGDVVSSSGSSYVCILDHTNHVPPNATYWVLLASAGATGATGATGPTGAGYGGSSTTSLAIGTGSKAFTTQAGLAYQVGNYVRASSAADGANFMEGYITAYSSTTLTVNVSKIGGSGTFADWNFATAGVPGTGDLLSTNNLSDVSNKNTSLDNLSLKGSNIVSAATINLETATGSFVNVTGSTGPITAITLSSGHKRIVYFASTPTFTGGASLVLLNGLSSLTVEAGAIAEFVADETVVRMVSYQAASSAAARALIAAAGLGVANNYTDATEATGAGTTAAALFAGGIEIAKKLFAAGIAKFTNSTASTSSTTGAVIITGGLGVGGAMNINGVIGTNRSSVTGSHFDASAQTGISIANGASVPITNAGYGAFFMLICEQGVFGDIALYLCSAHNTPILVGGATQFVVSSSPAAGKVGVYFDGTQYSAKNNVGSTITLKILNMQAG